MLYFDLKTYYFMMSAKYCFYYFLSNFEILNKKQKRNNYKMIN